MINKLININYFCFQAKNNYYKFISMSLLLKGKLYI